MSTSNLQSLRKHLNQAYLPPASFEDMSTWFQAHQTLTASIENSIERSIISGLNCAQLSFVFSGAYQSAMECMFSAERNKIAAFCHTERGVLKPRDMQTRFARASGSGSGSGSETTLETDTFSCSGTKHFVSGGQQAQSLFVSAIAEDGLTVKVLKLDPTQEGVHIEPAAALPFLPELSHGTLSLNKAQCRATDIMEGDGYSNYIKPFRTCEDLHILAGIGAYRLKLAWQQLALTKEQPSSGQLAPVECKQENQALVQSLLHQLFSIHALSQQPFNDPLMHLALADTKQKLEAALTRHDKTFAQELPEVFVLWERDKALLLLADKAQKTRTISAWQTIESQFSS
jgi:acyl-CoA dehydrogenase